MPATSRYSQDSRIALGTQLGTTRSLYTLRAAIASGAVPIVGQIVTSGDDRLDTIAGSTYGSSSYWWVLAAASNIGWGLQVPPNTVLNLVRLSDVQRITG
jgi:hypothetical protein